MDENVKYSNGVFKDTGWGTTQVKEKNNIQLDLVKSLITTELKASRYNFTILLVLRMVSTTSFKS